MKNLNGQSFVKILNMAKSNEFLWWKISISIDGSSMVHRWPIDGINIRKTSSMLIDGPLMAIDGPHGTAMAIDELRWDLSTGKGKTIFDEL